MRNKFKDLRFNLANHRIIKIFRHETTQKGKVIKVEHGFCIDAPDGYYKRPSDFAVVRIDDQEDIDCIREILNEIEKRLKDE